MRRRVWLAVSVFAFALACNESGPTELAASIEGTYGLSLVNGSPVPVGLVALPDYSLRVITGNFVINAGNTFSTTTAFEEMDAGQSRTLVEACAGAYTRAGFGLAFSETVSGQACGRSYSGGWNGGDTITVVYDASFRAVYTR
jgi:hypothetical protein